MKKTKIDAYGLLKKIKKDSPLVHHLTNWVTIYDCANIVKAIGGSPVMAHAKEEVVQMSALASSLVLNIGTLTPDFVLAMKLAARSANKNNIPVLLDACGAGATALRDKSCFELLKEARIDILKGNASEMARLAGERARTKGVDAAEVRSDRLELARRAAGRFGCVAVITGAADIVSDGKRAYRIKNGHPMMAQVVGTGCMASSLIGAFACVEQDLLVAAAAALSCFGIAAQLAAKNSTGPAVFKERLFDCLFNLDKKTIDRMQRIAG